MTGPTPRRPTWAAGTLDGLTPIATARTSYDCSGEAVRVVETVRWRPSRLVEGSDLRRRYGWVERP